MAIDLDAARRARREAAGKGPEVKFGGRTWKLPAEVPFEILEAFRGLSDAESADKAFDSILRALLGSQYDAFMAKHPSIQDVNELIGGVMAEYGVTSPLDSSGS